MQPLEQRISEFLGQSRIAVAGVSRDGRQPANLIFRKLRDTGHTVYPVNPAASQLEGVECYPDLRSIPGGVEALMVATPPLAAPGLVSEALELGVRHVWLHRSFGAGSVSPQAVELAQAGGLEPIAGACPMMYCAPVDLAHRCMRWMLRLTGGLPR